ncbi:hypothetical protein [Nocardioides sp. Iso805N]|uniref:hypothetical protein n=1 Tax=Nocardioides sp. Iso805N TaxID=1283287 RepID=UPI0003766E43|nr:hypothetical protein [Nocardioides sp. Iso805N]
MKPTPFPARLIATIAVLGVTVMSAGACDATSSTHANTKPPAIHSARPISSSRQIELPLASYLDTAADEQAYFAAVSVEQKRCAARYGVTSTMPITSQPSERDLASTRRYGVVDADEVARYGYHLPPDMAGSDDDDKADGWNPSGHERVVMDGTEPDSTPVTTDPETGKKLPQGGCAAEGWRVLAEGQAAPGTNDLVTDLLGQAWKDTVADPRALTAAKKWSACMATHGYDFKHRWDAGNSVGQASQQTQIAMAKLDLACATQTDYIGVWYAVDSAYQRRLIDQHQDELEEILDGNRALMTRVNKILQGR